MSKAKAPILWLALALAVSSCKKEETALVATNENFRLNVPNNMPAWVDDIENPLTTTGVKLGRLLFYDKRLSGNNKISCASCHQQDLAFSDGVALNNIGVSKQPLHRHAPALFNLIWANNGLFWDGGSTNLESQAFGPLTAFDEMGQDLNALEVELKAIPEYRTLFEQAFKNGITSANVVKALAQFQRTLISANSKYDKYRRNEGVQLSAQELEGMTLVEQKCKGCHAGELFTDNNYHNNGLDANFSDDHEGIHQGRFRVSYQAADLSAFKTPSLRNVMLTAPYMHDGRFANIDQVLEHYNSGLKSSASIDQKLFQNSGQLGIPLAESQKAAIKAFLNALTDQDFTNNKDFSNPHQ
ncbi:cytochrome-c peroxidase [Pedobacter sp. SL55]|uniref:cytochrome-c peroxidase n=1 Tax=Pedobacter sp. SL55 TaxID=2995161 RepID=UPI00227029A6|nr:cytochrome c peroxidase [Pedobacter sp. SL55]WAC39991.1 cytochrome-c peroxidase [Pedobacter sp. SL55]